VVVLGPLQRLTDVQARPGRLVRRFREALAGCVGDDHCVDIVALTAHTLKRPMVVRGRVVRVGGTAGSHVVVEYPLGYQVRVLPGEYRHVPVDLGLDRGGHAAVDRRRPVAVLGRGRVLAVAQADLLGAAGVMRRLGTGLLLDGGVLVIPVIEHSVVAFEDHARADHVATERHLPARAGERLVGVDTDLTLPAQALHLQVDLMRGDGVLEQEHAAERQDEHDCHGRTDDGQELAVPPSARRRARGSRRTGIAGAVERALRAVSRKRAVRERPARHGDRTVRQRLELVRTLEHGVDVVSVERRGVVQVDTLRGRARDVRAYLVDVVVSTERVAAVAADLGVARVALTALAAVPVRTSVCCRDLAGVGHNPGIVGEVDLLRLIEQLVPRVTAGGTVGLPTGDALGTALCAVPLAFEDNLGAVETHLSLLSCLSRELVGGWLVF